MSVKLKTNLLNFGKKDKGNPLLIEIKQLVDRINCVNLLFDYAIDQEMVSYYIHELNALNSQYAYLLRRIREENLKCDYEPIMFSERLYGKL